MTYPEGANPAARTSESGEHRGEAPHPFAPAFGLRSTRQRRSFVAWDGCLTAGFTVTKRVRTVGCQLSIGQFPRLVRGAATPARFNTAPSQGDPIETGCSAVILRLLAIKGRGSTLRPVVAVFTVGSSQELSTVEVVLTRVGGKVSIIGQRIPLVSGIQDLLGVSHALGERCLPGLQVCQPLFEIDVSFVGYPIE
jgi:hypothetical protein